MAPAKPERAREEAKTTAPPPATVFVASAPSLFVSSGGQPFLLLEATTSPRADQALSFRVAYLASVQPGDARSEDVPRQATASGAALLEAFTPLLPREVRDAAVTAVFGPSGAWGVGVSARFSREAGAWRVGEVRAAEPVLVPPLPPRIARSLATEDGAVHAARAFLERVDEGDPDGAWALTSAVVKAAVDRSTFVQDLWPAVTSGERGARRECFRQYEARPEGLGLGDVLQVCFQTERGADAVTMRLDDDQEWRVARVEHLARR